mmetsp:Transcript_18425/g.38359  ORF Transcript_18425/g.38359 Transcript_18425/m.38359 type:complete len:541 (-) Transcript_18425:30-1652(-)|eukprot:CAMPEP_0118656898 /NCGR_PEP_ID=MMETSP0785-20121206/13724_1 /TAXON_ID=91992 /ORGANISM="Bolidomonas pacifica, Strain CCMP 1866" /LENGTH=540 /DNA_ID=CAMNT_0006549767 /DNA_START=97 /DNA_END=1719 /DNA_ORIENTATION=+
MVSSQDSPILAAFLGNGVTSFGEKVAGQYKKWRLANSALGLVTWTLSLTVVLVDLPKRKANYLTALEAFPEGVSEHADGLARFMYFNDLALFVVGIISLIATALSYRKAKLSENVASACKLLFSAWLLNTAIPFIALSVVAGRSMIDWNGAVRSLCTSTFTGTMGQNGRYPNMWTLLNQLEGGEHVIVDPAWNSPSAEASIETFCQNHGWNWGEVFFGPLPTSSAGGVTSLSIDDLSSVCNSGNILDLAKDPDFPDAQKLICYTQFCIMGNNGACPSGCTSDVCSLPQEVLFEVMAYMTTLQVSALMANSALRNSEFIVGVIMGLYGVKTLLPPAISIIIGMMSGLDNVRLLFPSETSLSRMSMFLSFVTIPMMSAFLAAMQQVAGGFYLTPAVLLLLLAGCTSFYGHKVTLNPTVEEEGLSKVRSQQQNLRIACVLLAGLLTAFLLYGNKAPAKLMEYVDIKSLLSPLGLAVFAADSLSRSSITKVVSMDLVLYGLWKQHDDNDNVLSEEEKNVNAEKLRSMDKILMKVSGNAAAVAPS